MADGPTGCRLVVVTGGPGAGKTALLEVLRRRLCRHVATLPESASIVFGGGFPRRHSPVARAAAQRAIYHVQSEMESLVRDEGAATVALCDRGTLDGLAYWPGPPEEFWAQLGTTEEAELARYAAVIHLRVPGPDAYDHRNPLRVESAEEAAAIDDRVALAWQHHPRRFVVRSNGDFLRKLAEAQALVQAELPDCCPANHRPVVAAAPDHAAPHPR